MRLFPLYLASLSAIAACTADESVTPKFVHRNVAPDELELVDASVYDGFEAAAGQGGLGEEGEAERPGERGGPPDTACPEGGDPLDCSAEGEGERIGEGEGEGEGEAPCTPVDELCNGGDDDCDQQIDEGLDCDSCTLPCPVGVLPSDVDLCVSVDEGQACPADYPDDLGALRTGTPALDLACTGCTCRAILTPIHYDLTEPECGLPFRRDARVCEGLCEADLCGDQAAGHAVQLTLDTEGGQPDEDNARCTVQDEVTVKLCCRDSLPERPEQCDLAAFPGRRCTPPAGAGGPLLVRKTAGQPAVCARDELPGGLVFTSLEVQGAACGPCPCQAETTVSFCDGEGEPASCTATGAVPACQTECIQRPDPGRPVAELTDIRAAITLARSGEAPGVTGGQCVPTDARWVCDPRRVLFP